MVKNVSETFSFDLNEFDSSRALQVVTSGLSELLNHVTSLKTLLHLKTSLVSLMTEERMQQWTTVCNRLLNGNDKEIRLWNDLIKIELRTRAKVGKSNWRLRRYNDFLFSASTSRSF